MAARTFENSREAAHSGLPVLHKRKGICVQEWIQLLIDGVTIGGVYAVIALGYTLVYGVLRMINFAHGELFMMGAFTGYYTEWLWFRSLGFSSVFTKQLTTRVLLFGFFGLLMAAALGFTMWLAHRLRPAFRGMTQEQQNLERYRVSLDPVRRRVVIGVSIVFGLLAGGTAAGQWRNYLLFANSHFYYQDGTKIMRVPYTAGDLTPGA